MNDWKEIPKLMRERRSNPLVTYGFPPRRGRWLRILFVAVVIGAVVASWLMFQSVVLYGGKDAGALNRMFVISSILGVLSAPVLFSVMAFDMRRGERLEELCLTMLDPKEIVFGALYWGILTWLIFAGIFVVGHVAAAICRPVQPMSNWNNSAVSLLSLNWPRLALFLVATAAGMIKSIQMWLYGGARRHLMLPIVAGVSLYCVWTLLLLPNYRIFFFSPYFMADRATVFYLAAAGCVLFVGIAATAPRAAGLYFQSVDPELAIRTDWLVRERAAKKHRRQHGSMALSRLRRSLIRLAPETFIYSLFGTAITLVIASFLLLQRAVWMNPMVMYCVELLCGLIGMCAVGARRLIGDQPIPVISGMINASTVRSFLPSAAAQVIGYAGFYFVLRSDFGRMLVPFAIGLVLHLLFCYLCWLLILPRRGRRKVVGVVATVLFLFLAMSLVAGSLGETNSKPFNYMITALMVIITITLCCLPVGLLSLLKQRIHESEVLGHPAFMLSTEEPPAIVLEIMHPHQPPAATQVAVEPLAQLG